MSRPRATADDCYSGAARAETGPRREVRDGGRHQGVTLRNARLVGLAALLFVAGCRTQTTTLTVDGREAFLIVCSGMAGSWRLCYDKATDLCRPAEYIVLDRNKYWQWGRITIFSSPNPPPYFRSLVIRCTPCDVPTP